MEGLQLSDLIKKEDGYYVSYETLMEKDPEFAFIVTKYFTLNFAISPSYPLLPGQLYKVDPDKLFKIEK